MRGSGRRKPGATWVVTFKFGRNTVDVAMQKRRYSRTGRSGEASTKSALKIVSQKHCKSNHAAYDEASGCCEMKTKTTRDGIILHSFESREKGLLHSLFFRAMPARPLATSLHDRLEESLFETCYVLEEEKALLLAMLSETKADLEEESTRGDHDEKIGSTEEGDELLRLIAEFSALLEED